jgi:hypothetical protein
MPTSIIDKLNIPRDLILEFFVTFARFEYALKRAGYLHGNEQNTSADWDRFAKELAVAGEVDLAPVFQAAEYLESTPPMKQIKNGSSLGWARLNPMNSRIERLLFDLRIVRNNMFHGGKFPNGPVEDPARDEELIRSCLAVLCSLLELPTTEGVAHYFREKI